MSPKQEVLSTIKMLLEARVETARKAMNDAQDAANEEGKSSAGDKYETGRAMAQNLRDMNARQLEEANQLLENFKKGMQKASSPIVQLGSLVQTEAGLFYIGPGLGKIEIAEGESVWALSFQSPLGKLLSGKKKGDQINWMGKTIQIQAVY